MTRVLKIGGSILTDKNRDAAARPEEIRRVAEEIASLPDDLVLVHGAGSFGHIPAKRYCLPESFSPEGLLLTHKSVVRLNDLLVEALSRAGASPMPVHPLSCTLLKDGRIEAFAVGPVKEMVRDGLLPVLHGDVAMDVSRKAGIVSGDQLVPCLARSLGAEVVAVGTDVDGVLLSGSPLVEMTRADMPSLADAVGGSLGVDVTGGMKGKLLELLDLADDGIGSVIFNASKEGNISRALQGEPLGTRVKSA
ncbi:MAG TPA: isopentenyl phosphate kinase [Methanothrix sp.]|nr:isopentenyl phosphate kinase [Methanothrix sp.]